MLLLNPHLEAFVAVAAQKSMHGGARIMHLSQTSITQRIFLLEQKLNTTLFIRTRQGVTLTPEGEALLRYCQTVSDLSGETLAQIKDFGSKTAVRISITGPSSIMSSRIIPQSMRVMKQFPQLLITFDVNDDSIYRLDALRTGASQFAILEPENLIREMQHKKLQDEKYLLVGSHRWKKRKTPDIIQSEKIIDFDENDPTTFNYLKKFKLFNLALKERLFVNRTESLVQMIENEFGYGVLTEEFSKPYLHNKQLIQLNDGKIFRNELTLAWYNRPHPPNYFSHIIETIF